MQPIKIAQHLPAYNKKHHKTCGVFCLARLEGLEPPTYWFVADSFSSFTFVSNQKTAILSHLFYLSFGYSIIFSGHF